MVRRRLEIAHAHFINVFSMISDALRQAACGRESPRRAQDGPGERPAGRRGGCRITLLQLFYSLFMMSIHPALWLIVLALDRIPIWRCTKSTIIIVFWRRPCRKSSPNASRSSGRPSHYICSVWRLLRSHTVDGATCTSGARRKRRFALRMYVFLRKYKHRRGASELGR